MIVSRTRSFSAALPADVYILYVVCPETQTIGEVTLCALAFAKANLSEHTF